MSLSAQEKRLRDLVIEDKLVEVEAILKEGVQPNFKDEHRVTPLDISDMRGNVDMYKLLCKYGAEPDEKHKFRHHAAREGHVKIIELPLEAFLAFCLLQ
ncbi:hypothetical protein GGI42DRAFT_357463 [Trichoderma sp. SZMC 28013]